MVRMTHNVPAAWCRVPGVVLAALLTCASIASAQGGTVAGTISTTAKGAAPVRVTIDQKICGNELPDEAIVVDGQGHLANAVVILTGLKRPVATDPMVTNEKCRFAPRVQLARPNASIKTTSKDPMLHTTQAQLPNGATLFNVALPMAGITLAKPISAVGPVRLNCNIHNWMRGWLVVTDEAAAVTGVDGRFSIANVPPGTYELRVWHESLKGAPQKVTVTSGKSTDLALTLK